MTIYRLTWQLVRIPPQSIAFHCKNFFVLVNIFAMLNFRFERLLYGLLSFAEVASTVIIVDKS